MDVAAEAIGEEKEEEEAVGHVRGRREGCTKGLPTGNGWAGLGLPSSLEQKPSTVVDF
jgi:predicted transposase YdaD